MTRPPNDAQPTRNEGAPSWTERLLTELLASSGLGLVVWDATVGEARLDERARVLHGIPAGQEVLDLEAWLAAVHADDRPGLRSLLLGEDGGADAAPFALAYRVGGKAPDATRVRISGRLDPPREDGAARGVALVRPLAANGDGASDGDAERELRRSERRFRALFEAAPFAVAVTDPGGEVLDVNPAFERLTGYARAGALGRKAAELGLPFAPRADGQPPDTFEAELVTAGGEARHVLVSATPAPVDHVGGVIQLLLDVTALRSSQHAMAGALQEILRDTNWFASALLEKLSELRGTPLVGPSLLELTRRERDVLALMAQGADNERIGEALDLSASTVRNYVSAIYRKLGVHSRGAAIVWARERGLRGEEP